jgi:MFS family permease
MYRCVAQSTGVLVINNYQVLLYAGLGITGSLPLMLYAVYATWAAFLNWVGSMIVDRVGRIRMLTIGIVGCALMVTCETAMVARYGGTDNKIGNGFGVFFLFCFVTFYGSCVDAISYVYCSEIFPTSLRAQGISFSVVGLFAMTLSKLSFRMKDMTDNSSLYPIRPNRIRTCWLEVLPRLYHCATLRCSNHGIILPRDQRTHS